MSKATNGNGKRNTLIILGSTAAGAFLLPMIIPQAFLGILLGLVGGTYLAKGRLTYPKWSDYVPSNLTDGAIMSLSAVIGAIILPFFMPLALFGAFVGLGLSALYVAGNGNFNSGIQKADGHVDNVKGQVKEAHQEAVQAWLALRVLGEMAAGLSGLLASVGLNPSPSSSPSKDGKNDGENNDNNNGDNLGKDFGNNFGNNQGGE